MCASFIVCRDFKQPLLFSIVDCKLLMVVLFSFAFPIQLEQQKN